MGPLLHVVMVGLLQERAILRLCFCVLGGDDDGGGYLVGVVEEGQG